MLVGVRTVKRYTKFLLVGGANAVVDLTVLNALLLLIPDHSALMLTVDNTIAVSCAILNSYILNRRWTFSDRTTGSARERGLFFLQAVLNVVLNDVILAVCAPYLVFSRDVPLFVSSNVSKALAMLVSSSISYLLLRFLVFRGTRP
ncbi:MAG: GtrA family protein [Alicyclobacillus sp.]|nr:GtrA family protein [Alicyclobacillus sp.]